MKIQFIAELADGTEVQDSIQVATSSEEPDRNEKCKRAIQVKYPSSKVFGWIEVID